MTSIRDAAPGGPAYAGEVTNEAPVGATIGTLSAQRTPVRVPASRYTSPEFAALEMERLWPHVWQLACTVDHVREPGDWFEYTCGPLSVMLVRGDDGELRGFQNVCLHRGNELCHGSGTGRTEIRCVYHRWCWDLDGRLREIPSRRGFGVIRNDEYALRSVQVGTWGALVFVNLDLDAEPLARVPRARRRRDGVAATRRVHVSRDRHDPGAVQLEGHDRRVQRDVPRAGHPPADDPARPTTSTGRSRSGSDTARSNQPYGIPSPRLRDGATDQEIWESFVRDAG